MKILLVEDDKLLCASLAKLLESNHYVVELATDGQAGLALAKEIPYDLILLDVQIPKLDGIHLCQQLRSQGYQQPILLLTANASDADAVAGFNAGADDYISKPYAPEVLLARIRTLLRRSRASAQVSAPGSSPSTLNWGNLCLDPSSGRVTFEGQAIPLTATEYNLLELFLLNPDRIFSRSAILDRLWGLEDAPTDRAIVTHVKDVRKKLRAGGLTEDLIETVYGMGYRLKPYPESISPAALPHTQPNRAAAPAHTQAALSQSKKIRSIFRQQIAILQQASTALLSGAPAADLRQAARQEAHKLAGSMASFGYPNGSKLARSIEHLLIEHAPEADQPDCALPPPVAAQLAQLVAMLQQELQQPIALPQPRANLLRVLLIGTDATLTASLAAESAAWGLQIQTLPDNAGAQSPPTACAVDLVLLSLSGLNLQAEGAARLQARLGQSPTLPVVVLGRDRLSDRLEASRLGARQFLCQPAAPEQIFRAILQVLAPQAPPTSRVMILDDDPVILQQVEAMLTPWGIQTTTLSQPEQFWQVLLNTTPDLLILDVAMPELNGIELCQIVRNDPHWGNLPILFLTAHQDTQTLVQAFAAGGDDYIHKPILEPELIARVLNRLEPEQVRRRQLMSSLIHSNLAAEEEQP